MNLLIMIFSLINTLLFQILMKKLPALFIMEIADGKYIIIKNHRGQLTNLTTDIAITQQLIENKHLFSFSINEEHNTKI